MKLTEYFIHRPTLFWSLMVGILLAGIYSYIKMPKLEDPTVSVKQAMVITQYPGASAHEVELKVTSVIEQQLRTMPDVSEIQSQSTPGMSSITVEIDFDVMPEEMQQRWDLLRRKVNDIAMQLPQDCNKPIVVDDVSEVYGMYFAVTAKGYDYPEMYKWTDYLRRELLAVDGVKRAEVKNDRQECIDITLNKEQVSRNSYLPMLIMSGLHAEGAMVNAGAYRSGEADVPFRVDGIIKNEKDVSNLMIKSFTKQQMKLGDIAKVKRTYTDPQTNGMWINGEPAISLMLSAEDDANVSEVGKAVMARLNELKPTLPAGFEVQKVFFQPDKVDEANNSFAVNLIESVIIVIIALMFAMGIRPGLIIGAGLIFTIAASFPILLSLGTTMQRISLGAFIVAMGMLVDNSIVIIDGILVDKGRGLPPKKYLFNICKKTAFPLLGATIIASVTFIEVYLAKNSASEYAHDLFLVIAVSLLVSWVLALTQTPMFAKIFLPARMKVKADETPKDPLNTPVNRKMKKAILFMVDNKKTAFACAIAVLLTAAWGFRFVKNLFFPDCNYNQFVVEYTLPPETGAEKVKTDLLDITNQLLKNKEIHRVIALQGGSPGRYCLLRPMSNGGENYGELLIDCEDYNHMCKQIPIVRKLIRESHPEAYVRTRKYNFSIETSHTVEAQFTGPDPAVLRDLAAQAEAIFRANKGVDSLSVSTNWDLPGKAIFAVYNQQNGRSTGIGRADVGNALQAVGNGLTGGVLYDNDRIVPIYLKIRNADGSRINDINNIPVWTTIPNADIDNKDIQNVMSGALSADDIQDRLFHGTPLSSIADSVRLGWEERNIWRFNCQRAIEAQCDPDFEGGATAAKVLSETQDQINAIHLPAGYHWRWMGETKTQTKAQKAILDYIPLISVIILVVLLLLFGNWKKVIIILSCLPFVIVGISPALALSGKPFTFMALLGILGLVGMMVKNSIVLVDEVSRLTHEGVQPYKALIDATVSRIRPVFMASLTTVVGMIPLLTDPMYASLAVVIMAGLTMGTIITLLLLPTFYALLFHIRKPKIEIV
jgi:multidrug efflux pump subunit AcrB